jgi:hypothetical protein
LNASVRDSARDNGKLSDESLQYQLKMLAASKGFQSSLCFVEIALIEGGQELLGM